jgi:hypothetical protein
VTVADFGFGLWTMRHDYHRNVIKLPPLHHHRASQTTLRISKVLHENRGSRAFKPCHGVGSTGGSGDHAGPDD